MKLVMTLLVRDEADVVEAQLAFHLNAGVDFVIATDNRSQDGTTEILEALASEGCLHLIREDGVDFRQKEWVTRMARLAATRFGADWIINADADEFWWPRGNDLKEVLEAIPPRYGIVKAIWRPFVARPEDGRAFFERMTARISPSAPINDGTSTFRPQAKVAHRADPEVTVGGGNHTLVGSSFIPLRGWYPIEVLHFPVRSLEQWEQKNLITLTGWKENPRGFGTAYHEKVAEAHRQGRMDEHYASLTVDDAELARGIEEGSLTIDTRLRDVLGALRRPEGERSFAPPSDGTRVALPLPSLVDDLAFAVDAAALVEADGVRFERRIDLLEQRLAAVETRLAARVYRKASKTAKRVLRRR